MSKPPRLKGEALAAAVQSLETAWVPTVEISTLREGTVIPVASAASGLVASVPRGYPVADGAWYR